MSNRELANYVGVSEFMVRTHRAEMESTAIVSQSPERTGRDGRTIDTTNIGVRPAKVGEKVLTLKAEEAEKRMKAGKKIDPMVNVPQGTARDAAGKAVGVSGSLIDRKTFLPPGNNCSRPAEKIFPRPLDIFGGKADIAHGGPYIAGRQGLNTLRKVLGCIPNRPRAGLSVRVTKQRSARAKQQCFVRTGSKAARRLATLLNG